MFATISFLWKCFGIMGQEFSFRGYIMQTVQVQIDDKYFDSFLALINNLKDGMVRSVKIDSDALSDLDKQHEINKSYFQNAIKEVESGTAKLISHEDVWGKVSAHIKAHS